MRDPTLRLLVYVLIICALSLLLWPYIVFGFLTALIFGGRHRVAISVIGTIIVTLLTRIIFPGGLFCNWNNLIGDAYLLGILIDSAFGFVPFSASYKIPSSYSEGKSLSINDAETLIDTVELSCSSYRKAKPRTNFQLARINLKTNICNYIKIMNNILNKYNMATKGWLLIVASCLFLIISWALSEYNPSNNSSNYYFPDDLATLFDRDTKVLRLVQFRLAAVAMIIVSGIGVCIIIVDKNKNK